MTDRKCTIDGCGRTPRNLKAKWCGMHYFRWYRNGDPERLISAERPTVCMIEGCDKRRRSRGMCKMHSTRQDRHGDPMTVDLHPNWGGDDITYRSMHSRLQRMRGPANAQPCAHCGGRAAQWAYDHLDSNEKRSDAGLPYSTNGDHYLPLCGRCHYRLDHPSTIVTTPQQPCVVTVCDGPRW
jgi:hypothetical protein